MDTCSERGVAAVIAESGAAEDVVAGRCLYVAGSDLFIRLNQPAQRLPLHWAAHVEQLDLVGYAAFYDGPPAPALARIRQGIANTLARRVTVTGDGAIRRISARRLRLPSAVDLLAQDLWLYAILRPHLARHYAIGIVYDPESALLAACLKRSGRVETLVYHDIDYYPAVHPHGRRITAWRERMLVRMADAVLSVSRPLVALREQQGARRVFYLPNGVDYETFSAANRLRAPHPPTLLYAGTLDLRWGVDLPIRALPRLRERLPGVRLLIAGDGPASAQLRALAGEAGVSEAVRFLGFVPYDRLPAIMAEADLGLATSREDIFRQYASPLKIVEYMAAGLPVICSGGGEAALMVEESGGGVNIPFVPEALAEATAALLAHQDALATRRNAAVAYARGRTWDSLGRQLAADLRELARDGAQPRRERRLT
ncbi:MAG TPA: glycosyltransferase [Aggregatilineaceae bacterium]|nr:glycosyltransferase [Aggregatilineaceae bacterium]